MSQEVYRQRLQSREEPQGLLRGFVPVGAVDYVPPPPRQRKLTAEEQARQRAAALEPQAIAMAASLNIMDQSDRREQLATIRRNDRQLYGVVVKKLGELPKVETSETPGDGSDLSAFINRPTNEQQLLPPVVPPTYTPNLQPVQPAHSLHAALSQSTVSSEVPLVPPTQTAIVPPPAVDADAFDEGEADINAAAEAAASEEPTSEA